MKIAVLRSRISRGFKPKLRHNGDDADNNKFVEIVLDQKQHNIISYDQKDMISSVVVTDLPVHRRHPTSATAPFRASISRGDIQQGDVPTAAKKQCVRTNDIRNRNIEAPKRRTPTNRRRHRVSASFSSSVGRPHRDTYHIALQEKARSDRYDKLCRTTKGHRRHNSSVSVASRGRPRERPG